MYRKTLTVGRLCRYCTV